MRIQFMSDLHLEFLQSFPFKLKKVAPILVLCGDIGYISSPLFHNFIDTVCSMWDKVIFVYGNHEFQNIDDTKFPINVLKSEYTHLFSKYKNLIVLDNDTIEIDDIVFIGTTLWSYIPSHVNDLQLNDFKLIYTSRNTLMNKKYYNKLFLENLNFLKNNIDYYSKLNKKIVILTHHSPLTYQIQSKYSTYYGYGTNICEYLCNNNNNNNVVLWIFGHTHENCNIEINGVQYITNQLGYSDENINFNPIKNIEI